MKKVVLVTLLIFLAISMVACGGSDGNADVMERKYKPGDIGYITSIGSRVKYLSSCPTRVDGAGDPIGVQEYTPKQNDKVEILNTGVERKREDIPGATFQPVFFEVKVLESTSSSYKGKTFWIAQEYIRDSKY